MTESAAATGQSDGAASQDAAENVGRPPWTTPTDQAFTPAREATATAEQLVERVDDLARVVARQASTLERLADEGKARAQRERAGADVPLVVELFALHEDARTLAGTAGSDTERSAFETFAARVERLLAGRGGRLVEPTPGAVFDALTMEAADVCETADPEADRTVDTVITPGLLVGERSVRAARVVVRRFRAPKAEATIPG
ncbi:nucleotide exchange factor GrpE [Nocardia uniformis]|uniref:nucleotide exchange factor GrpE n=1 Tax=Nocardia uniformis TaxID=53432 RepID=UPI001FE09BD0|nr:nucleotide exchange factor GrpE [Nocardia uniformis]